MQSSEWDQASSLSLSANKSHNSQLELKMSNVMKKTVNDSQEKKLFQGKISKSPCPEWLGTKY